MDVVDWNQQQLLFFLGGVGEINFFQFSESRALEMQVKQHTTM